ncbi:Hho1 histone H1 [Candida orthopsilosis Co 90-125]|uniref:Histone H1 n=1 Tax=Candida orthopsilosis (strain 90-125) TaxID=1136231 RepID=H8XAD4_CANO9|nr:Hho1 histone H1 [Candida orthopsilosis Co 90-125]CCG25111.1 Hho1 histone H1 [Candida orthopsilosis Co 90-125]
MATAATATSASNSKPYRVMIKEAISNLKERNGSSRQALKKYVQSNNDIKAANFDSLFNSALKKGVDVGEFLQPKGPSGPVKLNKKATAIKETKAKKEVKKPAKKPSATAAPKKVTKKTPAKATTTKKTTTKKAATAKPAAAKKTAAKKAAAPKKAKVAKK